ncbi:MAG: germination protein YpeB [Clostridia bacterium]|nr:germination protein YpeB [Clostridia bacterium]
MEEKKNNAFEKVENVIKEKEQEKNSRQLNSQVKEQTNPLNPPFDDVAYANYMKEESFTSNLAQTESESPSVTVEKDIVDAVKGQEVNDQKTIEQKANEQEVLENGDANIHAQKEQEFQTEHLADGVIMEKSAIDREQRKRLKRIEKEKHQADIMAQKIEKRENRRLAWQQKESNDKDGAFNESDNEPASAKSKRGWMAAAITLGVVSTILSGVIIYNSASPMGDSEVLENVYRKSFYQTVEEVDNIDLTLSKLLATNDEGAAQGYLMDLAVNSEVAENEIQQLPLKDESKFYTTKLINQIGDYAKYLNKKLINGEILTSADKQNIENLYNANKALKESLQLTMQNMDGDFNFSTMGVKDNVMLENFARLQNLSVDFPKLIYDGPFSDGINDREIKGLPAGEITQAEARDVFIKAFSNKTLTQVENAGTTAGDIECYNVSGLADGVPVYAQISKRGGKIILFDCPGSCNGQNFSADYCTERAEKFLNKLEINNMKAVWINLASNVYTINFAYEKNGVVMYPDLIKVRVCAETADIKGMEAKSYYYNHNERGVDSPAISESTAKSKVNSQIEIDTVRLAVVPVGNTAERLCYEISGNKQGDTFYVYIDAKTGAQVEMFKVIESTEGTLLM